MGDRPDGKQGLAEMSMEAVSSGRVQFFPARYTKTYLDWLGEKRDWCISRQLWWGHRIPVWRLKPDADVPFGKRLGDRLATLASWIEKGRAAAVWGKSPVEVTNGALQLSIGVN